MKKRKDKRGLSTIIVTLIIVLLSLIAVGIIWAIVSRLLLNNTKGISLDKFTINGEIENVRINESVNNVSLTVARKSGAGEIEGMKFVFESNSGNEVVTEHFILNQLESKRFNFHLNMNVSLLKKISIIPLFESESGEEVVGNTIGTYNFGSGGGGSSGGTTTPCIPNCVGKNCGDDECGGSCGTCSESQTCNATGSCVANVTATAYYIDFQNGNDSDDGLSTLTAWKHVPGDSNYIGTGVLTPGNIVYFKKGVSYYGQITTISDNITYTTTNWGTGITIINGSGKDSVFSVMHNNIIIDGVDKSLVITGNSISHAAIWSYHNSHGLSGSVFKNLNITAVGDSTSIEGIGIKVGGNSYAYTNYEIFNNYISYVYSAAIKISGSGTKYIDIHDNTIEKSGDKAGEDTQINLSSNEGEGVQNVTVHDNNIRSGAGNANGINCNNANNEIYDNLIYGNGGRGISLNPGYNPNYNGVLKVYRNRVYNNLDYGIIIGTSESSRYSRIYNNIFYNNTGATEINFLNGSSYNEFLSNTVYHNRSGWGIRVQISSTNNSIKNNIVITNSSYVLYDSTGNITERNNLFLRTNGLDVVVWNGSLYSNINTYRTASGQGQNSMWNLNSYFTNTAINDYHLQSNSPCINNGTALSSYFITDFDGISRPQGSAWDIGAYEYH